MSWQEFAARIAVGLGLGAVGWGVSEAVGHPVAWWLCMIIGLALAFFAGAVIEIVADIVGSLLD